MGSFRRKQGTVATVAALADFTAADRERGLDLLQGAESVFVDIAAPSRLGTAVLSAALAWFEIEEEDSVYGPSVGAALLGYACRMAQPSTMRPANELERVERHFVRGESGALDYDAMAEDVDRLRGLADYVVELDTTRFQGLLADTPEAWEVFCTVGTQQLHKNLLRNGLSRRFLPPADAIRTFLTLGYAVRFIDETAGEAPYPAAAAVR